ncbi:DUF4387 domain-containing protein [Metabacillus indicus]|uniref:DUF4387 domain-containing protein n=1 Tax=Metabacillus indicus TaxID=246786 RepID=UPI003CE7EA61
MTSLGEYAKILRSKNSGPFEITLDVLFSDKVTYDYVKKSGKINKETICGLYLLKKEQLKSIVFYDQALGFKVTFYRNTSSGAVFDRDVYGAQQHAPLMNLEID